MKKTIRIINRDEGNCKDDLEYWLSRPAEERIGAVEMLREQYYMLQGYTTVPSIVKKITIRRNFNAVT